MEEEKYEITWLLQQVLLALGLTLVATAVMAFEFNFLSFLIGLTLMACAQKSLFDIQVRSQLKQLLKNEKLNDGIGDWLGSKTLFANADDYSPIYFEIQSENPDRAETREEKIKAWLSVVLGAPGFRRLLASFTTNLGLAYITEAGVLVFVERGQSSRQVLLMNLRDHFGPIFLVQALIFSAFWFVGAPGAYMIWVLAYATVFSVTLLDTKLEFESERWNRARAYVEEWREKINSVVGQKKPVEEAVVSNGIRAEVVQETTPRALLAQELPQPIQAPEESALS